jgi:hypothetical protein
MNFIFTVTAGDKMSLVGLLSAIAGFVKVRFLVDKEVIDNVIFRLHYRVTSAVLFVCCILCTANGLIGGFYYYFYFAGSTAPLDPGL